MAVRWVSRFFLFSGVATALPWAGPAAPAGMVPISAKGKSFQMGMAPSEYRSGDPWAHYENLHKVTFTYDFHLDTALVTQGEYLALMKVNPSFHKPGDLKLPVEQVSWFDAILYLNARSKVEKLDTAYAYRSITRNASGAATDLPGLAFDIRKSGYRLPTNAENEYATRAGSTGPYFFAADAATADRVGPDYVWWAGNAGNRTRPVGTRKPNAWGLYDMVGNLFAWCWDYDAAYPTADDVDPVGAPTGTLRVAKGGSFKTDIAGHMRIKYHYKWHPASTHFEVGFRGARTVTTAPVGLGRPGSPGLGGLPPGGPSGMVHADPGGRLRWFDFTGRLRLHSSGGSQARAQSTYRTFPLQEGALP